MRTNLILMSLGVLLLTGCASQSGNFAVGTESYGYALADQREALRTVRIESTLPEGAQILGPIDALRCHRSTLDAAPTEQQVIDDMRVLAYGKGADGIYNINVTKESGLLSNCWYVLNGVATMFHFPEVSILSTMTGENM